jgi:hypothetical protein
MPALSKQSRYLTGISGRAAMAAPKSLSTCTLSTGAALAEPSRGALWPAAWIADFAARGGKPLVVSTPNGDTNQDLYKALTAAGITADKVPVLALSVNETEVAALDTKPVGHPAGHPGLEAGGDAVIDRLGGQKVLSPSGTVVMMDLANHHTQRPLRLGRLHAGTVGQGLTPTTAATTTDDGHPRVPVFLVDSAPFWASTATGGPNQAASAIGTRKSWLMPSPSR